MGVKRVLRYLKGTLKYGLKFSAQEEKPDQHQAMCFRLEVELSAGQAGNNRQFPSHPLKLNMLL